MNKINVKKETIDTIKFVGLLILIFVVINLILTYIPPFNKYNVFAVQTDSMTGVIEPGDVVITKEVDPEDVQEEDIMAFYVDITGDGVDDVVVHYIDDIQTFGDVLIFKTRPHVSDLQDSWTIEETDLIGVYQYKVENLGKILLFLQSWVGRIILLIDIIIISVVYDILFGEKKDKKGENKEKDSENSPPLEEETTPVAVNPTVTTDEVKVDKPEPEQPKEETPTEPKDEPKEQPITEKQEEPKVDNKKISTE